MQHKQVYNDREKGQTSNYSQAISDLIGQADIPLQAVLSKVVDLIPSALENLKDPCVRITLEDNEFKSENFKETRHRWTTGITVQGKTVGCLEVFYSEGGREKPEAERPLSQGEEEKLLQAITAQLENIIELKKIEEELKNFTPRVELQGKSLDEILSAIADHFYLMDRAGRCYYVSRAAAQALGKSQTDIVNKTLGEVGFPNDVMEKFDNQRETVFSTRKSLRHEVSFRTARGQNDYEYIMSPVCAGDGRVESVVVIARDISARKQTEEALRHSEEEARRLAQENAVIAEIGRIIGSTLNIEEVYERFAAEAKKLIPFDRITITLINSQEKRIFIPYVAGIAVPGRQPGDDLPLSGTSAEKVLQKRSALIITLEDENKIAAGMPGLLPHFQAGLRSAMRIPLIYNNEVIGALGLLSTKPGIYNDQDLRLAQSIGSQIAGAIAHARLFAERQQAEEGLRREHQKIHDIIEFLPDATFVVDNSRRVILWNQAMEKITGVKKKDIIGKGDYSLAFYGKLRPILIDLIFEKEIEVEQFYTNLERKDGRVCAEAFVLFLQAGRGAFVFGVASPLFDGEGNLVGAIQSMRDITEQKNTNLRLLQSEKMASIGQLAAGVAHEINNPTGFVYSNLTTLGGYLKDLQGLLCHYQRLVAGLKENATEGGFPAGISKEVGSVLSLEKEVDVEYLLQDIPKLIEESQEGMERIKKIVQDLKNFAHPGDDKLKPANINKNLDSTLNVVWNELKYKASVTREYGDLPEVQCYPQQINQVFLNIMVNAAQAIQEKGEIRILTRAENGHVEIQISDTGCGIPPENLPKIFDPFFTTKEVGKGTGLGLNVAYNIIKKHNGVIDVMSEVGKGTTFILRLPVNQQPQTP